MSILGDRRAILRVLEMHGRPVLYSQIQLQAGELDSRAMDSLIRDGMVRAVFPEARPGDSGRQFWEIVP